MSDYSRPRCDWEVGARVADRFEDARGEALTAAHFNGIADLVAEAVAAERAACQRVIGKAPSWTEARAWIRDRSRKMGRVGQVRALLIKLRAAK